MSLNSPAKLERIERHLMRQRGAGTVAVSANFGFCFGSSVASSSSSSSPSPTAVHISHEPNTKRRRTALRTVQTSVPERSDSVAVPCNSEVGHVSPHARVKKQFKQGGDAADGSNSVADDSFVAQVRTRRKPEKDSKNSCPAVTAQKYDEGIMEAATEHKDRSDRREAAPAASEVTKDSTKRLMHADGHDVPPVLEDTHKKRRTKAAIMDSQNAVDEVQGPHQEPDAKAPAATAKRKGRTVKRETAQPCIKVTELPSRDHAQGKQRSPRVITEIENHSVRPKSLAVKVEQTEANGIDHAMGSGRSRVLSGPTVVIADKSQRAPLRESDRNALSISPDKTTTARAAESDECVKPRKANSTSSRVRRDDNPSSRKEKTQQPPIGIVPAPLQQHLPEEDEDVAWLLELAPTKKLAKPQSNRTKATQSARHTRAKMADIDLDDLLSDIASFAKADACVSLGERVDASRGTGQKSKRR